MHEISVLHKAVDLAEQTAADNGITRISYITLEIGELSGYLPVFFEKYFPVVTENRPVFDGCELRMVMAGEKVSAGSAARCTTSWPVKANAPNAAPDTRRYSAVAVSSEGNRL